MLVDYLPEVVKQIKEMQAITAAEQPEFDLIEATIEQILANALIATADEHGIEKFEKELGIEPTKEQTLEERRVVIMVRSAKKNLSFIDVQSIMYGYSDEIILQADYNTDEMAVILGDNVENVPKIYKILDDILSLQVFIYFVKEITAKMQFVETPKQIELETTINWWLANADAWALDGSTLLNGSRLLNSKIWTLEIEIEG